MDEEAGGFAAAVEFPSDANVNRSVVGVVKARDVHLTGAGAGLVAAGGNFSILNGGAGPVLANGSVTIRNGGCGPLVANGDVSIENGGTQSVIAAGGATIGPRAFVGVVVSPNVTVEEGGRVLTALAVRTRGRRRRGHRDRAARTPRPAEVAARPHDVRSARSLERKVVHAQEVPGRGDRGRDGRGRVHGGRRIVPHAERNGQRSIGVAATGHRERLGVLERPRAPRVHGDVRPAPRARAVDHGQGLRRRRRHEDQGGDQQRFAAGCRRLLGHEQHPELLLDGGLAGPRPFIDARRGRHVAVPAIGGRVHAVPGRAVRHAVHGGLVRPLLQHRHVREGRHHDAAHRRGPSCRPTRRSSPSSTPTGRSRWRGSFRGWATTRRTR